MHGLRLDGEIRAAKISRDTRKLRQKSPNTRYCDFSHNRLDPPRSRFEPRLGQSNMSVETRVAAFGADRRETHGRRVRSLREVHPPRTPDAAPARAWEMPRPRAPVVSVAKPIVEAAAAPLAAVRVLHVAETLIGGLASYIDAVASDQVEKFGRGGVRIIGPADQLHHLSEADLCTGFTRTGRNLTSLRRLQRSVELMLDSFAPNVVHAHSFFAGLVVRALVDRKKLAGVSVIYCPHGWVFCRKTSLVGRFAGQLVERALQARADQIHCISQYELQAGARAGIGADKMFCLPNRIPDQAPPSQAERIKMFRSPSALRVAFLGRLDRQKGFDILLQAARSLGPGVEILAAGTRAVDGLQPFDAPANVSMLGWLGHDAADALIRECDVVVVPSRWEGFGLVALEAMRAGKALVASRVDALPELVDHQMTGLLVPPEDPAALADALAGLNRVRAREMGAVARRKFALFFSFADYASALHWRYGALAGAQGAPGT